MKRGFYALAMVCVLAFAACSDDDHDDFGTSSQKDIEARATALGFDDVKAYEASVAEQCLAGNHENCDIQTDGKHLVCGYKEHSGTKHNQTSHNGTDHGVHDANGNHNDHNSSHNDHNGSHNGNHNNGGHH